VEQGRIREEKGKTEGRMREEKVAERLFFLTLSSL
jgi:hypothetical protein